MGSSKYTTLGQSPDVKDAVGFFSWDLGENRVFADHIFASIYGISPRNLEVGAPIEEVIKHIADGDLQRVAKALHETIISGKPCSQTYRINHPSGRKIVVTGQGRCLRNGEGVPSIYTGMVAAEEVDVISSPTNSDPLESHCLEALKIAKRRRHALAERYLVSALGALGRTKV